MPIETIRYVVQGANAQSSSLQMTFANNGSGSGTISLLGRNAGTDNIQAFLDAFGLSSNTSQVTWQNTNGPLSVSTVTARVGAGDGSTTFPASPVLNGPVQQFNGLMFNSHPQSIFPSDPHQSGNTPDSVPGIQAPLINNGVSSSGQYTGDTVVQGVTGPFNGSLTGSFVVANAGQVSFSAYVNSVFLMAIQGAQPVSGQQTFGPVSRLPTTGMAPQFGSNSAAIWPGGDFAIWTVTYNFPAPGVYPFEICFTLGAAGERQFCLLGNSTVIPTIALVAPPTPPAPGTGNLILTPTSQAAVVGSTVNISLIAQNIAFVQTNYMPFLEGTPGSFLIANDPNNPTFGFPALPNGGSINPSTILNTFPFSGDNASWQNRLSLGWNGTAYVCSYNGAALDPNVAITNLTVQNEDIAYYNPVNDSFDAFGVTNQGGGSSAQLPIYWLVNPDVGSVSPGTLTANGGQVALSFSLAKPMPPIQANTQATFVGSSGITVVSSSPNLNSSGWLTGWTVVVQTVVSSGILNSLLTITLTGSISFMSGGSLVTQNITYPNLNNRQILLNMTGI